MIVAHMKLLSPTTNCHSQITAPELPSGKAPPGIHRPRIPGCSRAGVQGAI